MCCLVAGREEGRGKEGRKVKVVGTHETTVLEEPEKIVVLSVDISADLDGSLELEEDGLRDEDWI